MHLILLLRKISFFIIKWFFKLSRGIAQIIGAIVIILILVLFFASKHVFFNKPAKIEKDLILKININGEFPEKRSTSIKEICGSHEITFFDVIQAMERSVNDPHIKGAIIVLRENGPSLAQCQEIKESIAYLQANGKPVWAYAYNLDTKSYYLISNCARISMPNGANVRLTGLSMELPFLKEGLDKIGVEFQVEKRKEYKSFSEVFTEKNITKENKEMISFLMNDLLNQLEEGISSGRKIKNIKGIIDNGPYTSEQALNINLINKIEMEDSTLNSELSKLSANSTISVSSYLEATQEEKNKKIAIIFAEGNILDDSDEDEDDVFEVSSAITPNQTIKLFKNATLNNTISAIIFRVNSPGGSASASELISSGIKFAKEHKKPVIVSMGAAAASGGYWISTDADHLIANPATLTGSIGVILMYPCVDNMMKNLGIGWEILGSHKNSLMWNVIKKPNQESKDKLRELADSIYLSFIEKVSKGRKISSEEIEKIAKGRVWTGKQAYENHLVDSLGGINEAIKTAKKLAGIKENEQVTIITFPEQPNIFDHLKKRFKKGPSALIKGITSNILFTKPPIVWDPISAAGI